MSMSTYMQNTAKAVRINALPAYLQIIFASFVIAIFAQIKVPLYFTPVPLTGLTLGVMLVATTLGSRKGVLSVLAYLAEGCMGLPVFASGSIGPWALIGPTGGYLLSLILLAFAAGWLSERSKQLHFLTLIGGLFFACALQLCCGAVWLSYYVGATQAFAMGINPFLIGDAIKACAIAMKIRCQKS